MGREGWWECGRLPDAEFEAFTFELLAEAAVSIPELGTIRATHPPIVILTSNRTRDLHDALTRRCLYHWIDYPGPGRIAEIVRRRVPASSGPLALQAAAVITRLRTLDLAKPYIDDLHNRNSQSLASLHSQNRFAPGTDTTPNGEQEHDFFEEVYIVSGSLTDLRLGRTFSNGMYPYCAHRRMSFSRLYQDTFS